MPGELGVELDAAGKLIRFRAIPPLRSASPKVQAKPDWQEWFPNEFTGFDLSALQPIEDRGMPPPDAFDQLQVWRGGKPGSGGNFYVQAAVYAGKPVFFSMLSPAEQVLISWTRLVNGQWRDPLVGQNLLLGVLAGVVAAAVFQFDLTLIYLTVSPLTTNFPAWYAGNGLAVVAILLALAALGFYTSRAGRPIFQDAPGDRTPN